MVTARRLAPQPTSAMESGRSCGSRGTPPDDQLIRGAHRWLPHEEGSCRSRGGVCGRCMAGELRSPEAATESGRSAAAARLSPMTTSSAARIAPCDKGSRSGPDAMVVAKEIRHRAWRQRRRGRRMEVEAAVETSLWPVEVETGDGMASRRWWWLTRLRRRRAGAAPHAKAPNMGTVREAAVAAVHTSSVVTSTIQNSWSSFAAAYILLALI